MLNTDNYYFIEVNSLSRILELHINCEQYSIRDFKTNFSNFIDFNDVNNILFRTLEEEIYYHYHDKTYEKIGHINFSETEDIKIKFGSSGYLLYYEALEIIQNIFLVILHDEILFKFYNNIIFYTSSEDLKRNGMYLRAENGNINYSALIYFIQTDWKTIKVSDIKAIDRNKFVLFLKINPFFNNKTETKEKINEIFELLNPIKINKTVRVDKFNRLKRLLCLNWIINSNTNYTHNIIYKELLKKYYTYNEYEEPYKKEKSYTAETSQYNKQIKCDLELIEKIKKLDLYKSFHKDEESNNFDTINIPPF